MRTRRPHSHPRVGVQWHMWGNAARDSRAANAIHSRHLAALNERSLNVGGGTVHVRAHSRLGRAVRGYSRSR
jgi:hypothetical protein